jgi:hypothetical protein
MAEGQLIAGFDAGQTHTTCRLANASTGQVVAEGQGPGVCHLAAPAGPERFAEALGASLRAARAAGGAAAAAPLGAAAVGASGVEQDSPVQAAGSSIAAQALGLAPPQLRVTGDERTALRGAFPTGPGIVVISGTGTIAVGRDGQGREHRCAGWGWLLDGAGSAMDIGRDGLALSLQMADGRLADTPLRATLWRALGLDPTAPEAPQQLKALVVQPDFGPAGFARLAPVVHDLACGGDPLASALLQRHGEALAAMAGAVAQALALPQAPVGIGGGALTHLGAFQEAFRTALSQRHGALQLVAPQGDGCAGALAMAADLANGG